ncbi:hypothetical protein HMN09_01245400 [Mycena chlorophos]|uniref:Uncharacterized protein n=1 Tax=Mycena chlorophos TaxID=658473 RepID=A0A8H6VVE7_MYCCL|nr:hypothetical protein HMN09_01245400 [Mycena chlorophos]
MTGASTLIVLGATRNAYYVGHGRRFFVEGLPESFMEHAKNSLVISRTPWISMNNVTGAWICHDIVSGNFHFNADIDPTLRGKLAGMNGAEFVTLPHNPDPKFHCVKSKATGTWSAVLPDRMVSDLTATKVGERTSTTFDNSFKGILFGTGTTYLVMFNWGFLASLDDDVRLDSEHPLNQILKQFNTGWGLEHGSTLSSTPWISMNNVTGAWICLDEATKEWHFSANIDENLRGMLSGANCAEFVTYPHDSRTTFYCAKGKETGAWNAMLSPSMFLKLQLIKLQVGSDDFNIAFMGMIFGKGKTYIVLFESGFYAHLDDEVESRGSEHPLYAILQKHEKGWCIERGSMLSSFDSRYYFLKLRQPGSDVVEMHWNLPPLVAEKLNELRKTAESPEEREALAQQEATSSSLLENQVRMQMQANSMSAFAAQNAWTSTVLHTEPTTQVFRKWFG